MDVGGVTWATNGTKVIAVGRLGSVGVWNYTTGEQTVETQLPDQPAFGNNYAECVASSRSGNVIAVGSQAAILDILDASAGKHLRRLSVPQSSELPFVAWHPDSERLASTHEFGRSVPSGLARLWDTERGELLDSLDVDRPLGVGWAPNGTLLFVGRNITGGGQQQLSVNPRSKLQRQREFSGAGNIVRWFHWIDDGKTCFVAWSKEWSDTRQQVIDTRSGQVVDAQDLKLMAFRWSPDEKRMSFSNVNDNVVRIWNRNTKQVVQTLAGHQKRGPCAGVVS